MWTSEELRELFRPSNLLRLDEVEPFLSIGNSIPEAEAFMKECEYWEDYEHAAIARDWIKKKQNN